MGLDLNYWFLKIIFGFVELRTSDDGKYKIGLISRISNQRIGTKYFYRGINDEGLCADFVETEQIVYSLKEDNTSIQLQSSFVQIRASAPIFFEQTTSEVTFRMNLFRNLNKILFFFLLLIDQYS
jgi:hypothetical protein